MATVTFLRVQVWRSEATLWAAEIQSAPDSIRGHLNLGKALDDAGDASGAATHALEVVRLSGDPRLSPWMSAYAWSAGLTNFARAALRVGDVEQAAQALDLVLSVHPDFAPAHFHRAVLALARNDCQMADEEFRIAQALDSSLHSWPCHDPASSPPPR